MRQLETLKAGLATAKAAQHKAEADCEESKRLEGQLRKAGGRFKEQFKQKEKELNKERATNAALEEQFRLGNSSSSKATRLAEENSSLVARVKELTGALEVVAKGAALLRAETKEVKAKSLTYLNAFLKANDWRKKASTAGLPARVPFPRRCASRQHVCAQSVAETMGSSRHILLLRLVYIVHICYGPRSTKAAQPTCGTV